MLNNENFKPPLSIAEIIDKLLQFKTILLVMLEDGNYFLQWAQANKLTTASTLYTQLRQHVATKNIKNHLIIALKEYDQKIPSTVQMLAQILKDDIRLRHLIISNQSCFRIALARWKRNPNTFFDDASDNALPFFAIATDDHQDTTCSSFFSFGLDNKTSCEQDKEKNQELTSVAIDTSSSIEHRLSNF